ncbi:thiamine biosynthesis protein ThiS [Paenibacillus selenitireducens]|uniref:Thiamine biosynthesis protein ThiS n=1 Tax=Paenibacillus selenitireducens TaxID=1324314 RepID=A0A1T2XCX3_9BACL|nr:sulfur carrier protein ThiS [Paenibacillus selenitireducens]OPA77764.1 thiamine biosynthesis protein ThiS [Paenibacillus selenitireducens]
MKYIVNGQSVEVPDRIVTVRHLLEHFGLSNKIVVVEVEHHIVDKDLYASYTLQEGVRIELVHFVGGG